MSHVDSKDEEKGTILEPENSDDSKESDKSKKEYDDEGERWETFDNEVDDDREW